MGTHINGVVCHGKCFQKKSGHELGIADTAWQATRLSGIDSLEEQDEGRMKVALFSDVHGRLRIMLHLLQCWQMEHRTMLDAALLAGDVGCFPDVSRFDKATRRWIERDPDEAGFPEYFMQPRSEIEDVFQGEPAHGEFSAVRCPVFMVAGNHEDFEFLNNCRNSGPAQGMPKHTFPVDCYGRIHCIENGQIVRIEGQDGTSLRIAGLWGVEKAADHEPKKISAKAATQLMGNGQGSFDLLVTHDAPNHSYLGHASSETISVVLEMCRPPLHLFGHAHPVNGQHEFFTEHIPTHSWIFEDVCFGKQCTGNLERAMGLLTWNSPEDHKIEMVTSPWLGSMRHRTWSHVWP
ncbi:MAG: hypothetical protein C0404_14850 [Verrucomicrobia bacterium]|nr:hypothetical protein [Verrucomicrobiota bacterium]